MRLIVIEMNDVIHTAYLRSNNDVISAIVLLLLEAIMFGVAIWLDIIKISLKALKIRIISMQMGVHFVIGLIMGSFYSIL